MVHRLLYVKIMLLIQVLFFMVYPSGDLWVKNNYSSLLDTVLINKSFIPEDIDLVLGNCDLRSYYVNYDKDGYYQKVIRLSFIQNFVPITFEIGMVDSSNYDLIIKHGTGKTIILNNYPIVASSKNVLLFKNIKNKDSIRRAGSLFSKAASLPPVATRSESCPFHHLEYRCGTENEDTYYKYTIWCQIRDKEQLQIITDIYLLVTETLAEKKVSVLLLAQWEDMILRWNKDIKKM